MSTTNTSKCIACEEDIIPEDAIQCTGDCKGWYHFYCAGFVEKKFRLYQDRENWKCLGCKTRRVTHRSTNLEDDSIKLSESDTSSHSITILDEIRDLKSFVQTQFLEYSKSLNFQEGVIKDLTTTINAFKEEIKTVKEENASLKAEIVKNKAEIDLLKSETLEMQQYSRRMNLEISGFPEVLNEDTLQVVKSILNKLDVNNHESILVAHRIPSARKDRHKSIIVQFSSKHERDRCLTASKEKRIKASNISERFDATPIYLNEHLAPGMKKLLFLSKQFKRERDFKFCWVRDGKIFLRRDEEARVYKIRKESDLTDISI